MPHLAPLLRHHFNIMEICGHHTLVAEFRAALTSSIRPSMERTSDRLSQYWAMSGIRACKSGDKSIETWVSARITANIPPDSARYEDAFTPQLVSWTCTAPAATH